MEFEMAARRVNRQPEAEPEVNVFDFLDYRAYLRAYYERAKRRPAGFSFRTFSKRAGLKSPNFFKLVIDGDRNLGKEMVPRFADALGLEGETREFFSDLVAFEQAGDSSEKNRAFERIAASRRFRSARRIDGMLHEYLSHWYHPAIRELVVSPEFQADPEWLAKQLRPTITPRQAAHSLKLLIELGL
ncbi:MAG TPA: TIGR02147 family protein, partial [Polyangiaceae bacterium]